MNTKKALIFFLLGLVMLSPVLGLAEVKKEYYPNGKLRAHPKKEAHIESTN